MDDAAVAGGCVNRVEELFKKFLRGEVTQLLAKAPVQLISDRQEGNGLFNLISRTQKQVNASIDRTFPDYDTEGDQHQPSEG